MVKNPECLSDNTSGTVSYNRISYFLTRNYSAAVPAALIFPEITDESVIYAGFALFKQESELTVVLYTKEFSGIFSHFILVCQALSALSTSSCKYLTAVSCLHSFSEAVFLLSLELLGLICSFHVNYLSFLVAGSSTCGCRQG